MIKALGKTSKRKLPLNEKGGKEGEPDKPEPVSTFIVIPYFPGDRGRPGSERPLPAAAISWLCPSIVVNGQAGGAFKRGEPTDVTVAVANWGAGTGAAPVQVSVWWVDPSTGFTDPTLFGQTVVAVPTGGQVFTSPVITGIIPQSAPQHVCLVARVSSPYDIPTGGAILPGIERHWAQHNLVEATSDSDGGFQYTIRLANPFDRAMAFDVRAEPVDAKALRTLGETLQLKLVDVGRQAESLSLHLATGGKPLRRLPRASAEKLAVKMKWTTLDLHQVKLGPRESRQVKLAGKVPEGVGGGSAFAVEVRQSSGDHKRGTYYEGSVGLIVRVKG